MMTAKKNKIKMVLTRLVSYLPTNTLRLMGYRLFSYSFGQGCKVDWGVWICVDGFTAGNKLSIRRRTRILGPISVDFKNNVLVGRGNRIECGWSAADPSNASKNYARSFKVGENCLLHEDHLFDVYGSIHIDDGSWVAGFASQFLTHGASAVDRDIYIGKSCYVGSAVRFAPGASIGNECIVGMGAVVTKKLEDDRCILGGVPARVLRQRETDDAFVFVKSW